ncbi:MAG: hypothetical protein KKB30_04050 [Proteobacteria bacterium]|nr:hypothetical protein [Pseudomonadota bacterium]MBU1714906.1 hypothetical protein [Pseudomonadota bacterium]
MKKSANIIVVTVAVLTLFSVATAFAADPPLKRDTDIPGKIMPKPPRRQANLSISNQANAICGCAEQLDKLDVRLYTSFILPIRNDGPDATTAKVEVSFFDLTSGGQKTLTVNSAMIQPGSFGSVNLISNSVLIKKSRGFTAKVMPATMGVIDPNTSDNTVRWDNCPYIN